MLRSVSQYKLGLKENQYSMTEYNQYSREELIKKIESLELFKNELLRHQQEEERLEFAWTGNLGHWFWDFTENQVTFNPLKAETLGYKKEDLGEYVPFEFFTEKIHPQDYDFVMNAMRDHLKNKTAVWEVKYRIETKDGSWKTYYDRGKVTVRDAKGQPLFLSGIVFDVTENEIEKERLIQENNKWSERAKIDQVTSLYNRTTIMYKVAKISKESREKNVSMIVAFIDIDYLDKQVEFHNTIFENEILGEAGIIINKHVKENGVSGRYSGGRFLLIFQGITKEEAYKITQDIRMAFKNGSFSQRAEVTLSGGLVEYDKLETVGELMNRAERKLHQAKKNGKDQIVM